jgi:hypothetical protein
LRSSSGPQASSGSAATKLDKLELLLNPTARNVPQDLALIAELLAVPLDGRYPVVEVSPQHKREMTLAALLARCPTSTSEVPQKPDEIAAAAPLRPAPAHQNLRPKVPINIRG